MVRLQDKWFVEAGKYFGIPLENRGAIAVLTTPRPQMSPPRNRYIYYPHTLEVPEAVAVNVRGRSFKIAAEVKIATPAAAGVLFAHGHKFGGHALYIKDGKLKYVYNYLGMNEQMITSNVSVPTGKVVLGVEFAKEKLQSIRNAPFPNQCIGTATLYINDQKVGEFKGMATQLGKFALTGEGLNIGRDGSVPVTSDYPGPPGYSPAARSVQVIVDVSDEPYQNLELEAMAVLSREEMRGESSDKCAELRCRSLGSGLHLNHEPNAWPLAVISTEAGMTASGNWAPVYPGVTN